MGTKQYVYKKSDVIAVVNALNAKYGSEGLIWGNSSAFKVAEMIERLSDKYGDLLEAPRLANEIRNLETSKMVGGANKCLDQLIRGLKEYRIAVIDS
ncbi:hypothetical protein [Vibrio coralliilyticus]|uniref:hypothetical protein n=1 Tax=Vibrio coralliilyticus TaxID=190893 RepID=UPI000C16BADB|nr:hypothetical protein [Vibrio coralliilyticus]